MEAAHLTIYRLKVVIQNTKPPIWRRIDIPENYTFFELHVAIQDAFQWTGHQYHIFEMGKGQSNEFGVLVGIPDECGILEILPDKIELISSKFTLTNKNCVYSQRSISKSYVNHTITLEEISAALPNVSYPRCIAGRQQAPAVLELLELNGLGNDKDPSGQQKFSINQISFRDPNNISDSDDSDED